MSERTPAPAAATEETDAGSDESGLRTATRLLRLLKLASGALVSVLTALKLLGLL